MATPTYKSLLQLSQNALISPWKGQLIIQGCLLCDITLWSTHGTGIPVQLPQELDFKYVMKVSSLKESLPEAAFGRQNYLEQKVCCQDLCFDLYEVELSNKQGENIDKLIRYIKNKQLAIIKCLEDGGFFILLTSSALTPEPDFGDKQMGLHGLHLFHSPQSTGAKDLKVEDGISLKVIPILPALSHALLEAKKSLPEKGIPPNILVKHSFQDLFKVDKSLSLMALRDEMKDTAFKGKLSHAFDLAPPLEKCPSESLTQLKSYFLDPSGYTLDLSAALDLLAEHPQCPCISDGICDAGFSLVMTPDPEFLDSEMELRKETETSKKSGKPLRVKKRAVALLTPASNLRVQPKRKASTSAVMLPNKRVSLGRPLSKRTASKADSGSCNPTLKLVKGQFPQKRKRGAEVLTAQFVQKTRLDRKKQEASVSKDAPVATNAKRAKKQEKSPGRVVSRPKPSVKKSTQKRKVNVARGRRNPRTRKQPQPAEKDIALHLQSEISSNGQIDGTNLSTAQQESITVIPKGFPENSIVNCDSQALNMLADLALSSAASSIPSSELRTVPCFPELPQNNVLLSKENSLHGTTDHEYHRGVKNQKGILLPKPSSDEKIDSKLDLPFSQEENMVPCAQPLAIAQPAPAEEARESSDASQNSVAVEHSYALLLAEQSKKHLHQRKLPSPAFAKNGAKGPEAGTPIGKVMPFRHLQNTSPLQKRSEDSLTKRKSLFVSSSIKDVFCSHTVLSCDGSFKITFKCEGEYAFNLDSKYTSNSLEKTVVRALHGPWNTDLPENMEDVKLLLHMWVALFYSKKNKIMGSPRKVVEHRNPAKYVCINRSVESFDQSEIEEFSSVERYSIDHLLETKEAYEGHATNMTFPGPNCVLPFISPPTTRDLELCVQNEQKEMFTGECHLDTSGSQNFTYSCNNEVTGGKDKQELPCIPETSNVGLSGVTSAQSNGSCIPSEDKTLQSTKMVSCNDSVTQATLTTTYEGARSESMMCQKSVVGNLENKDDTLHPSLLKKTGAVQDVIHHSSPVNNNYTPSVERTDDDVEYMMINLEPVTLAFEKTAYIPIHKEVNTADKPTGFNTELVKQVSSALSIQYSLSTLEKAQTECPRDIPSLAISEYKASKCLSASSLKKKTPPESLGPLQKEIPPPTSADEGLITEALPLVKSSSYSLANDKTKCPQDSFLQTQNGFRMSLDEVLEPSQVKASSPTSATLGKKQSLNCIPAISNVSDDSSEVRNNDKSSLNQEKALQTFNSLFPKQTDLSMNKEEVSRKLSGEDSDIDLTLTVSPHPSSREEMAAGEIKQLQRAPISNLGLQSRTEEMVEPEAQVSHIKNEEISSASFMSVFPVEPREPLKETQSSDLKPGTLILSKENCSPEVTEEINVPSGFPFGPLIEEVSPASSPDPIVQTEETQPSPCCLKPHGAESEKSSNFSQIKSGDLTIPEKGNSFVGPKPSMGQDKLPQVQVQISAEMPQILNNAGIEGRVTVPGEITEFSVPSEHNENLSFSEKVQCYDTELSKSTSPPKYRADISKSINEEPSASFVTESVNSVCGVYKEHIVSENPNMGHKTKADSETLSRNTEISVNASMCYGPLSEDTDQDSLDCRNCKLDSENLCTLRGCHANQKDAVKDSNDSFTGLNISDNNTWVYSNKISELETHIPCRSWDTELCPISTNKCMPRYVQIPDSHGIPRTYANFTISKESRDTTRTLHSLKRHRNFTANCGLLSSWTSTWHVADDLTQNTLDLEYLRFDHKLKQIVKKVDSQQASPNTSSFSEESLIQISVRTHPSTQTADASLLRLPAKSRSPILVTVGHSDTRQQSHRRRSHSPSNLDSSSFFWREQCSQSRNLKNSERSHTVPVHLNKLKYNSTLKEGRNDISLILNEYAEFNKVMMNSDQIVSQEKELSVASAEAVSQETCQPRQSVSYKDVITDLCATLHIKLKGVMREACKSPFWFYLVETEDKSFFLRTKSILKKGGHSEIELLDFCQAFQGENETLLVIIKNEDIMSHLHQIPSLLKLKHLPSVIFAGVDSPEDILNDTYQELFRSGGFVVSDDNILESLTLVQLKEIVTILEKLNENGRWKWLLHYRENKKLKEDVRVDSIAHKKNLILKSYQSVNIIELLHYHNCDSPSPTKAENLKCLLNLQVQHISARFAVFLTDKPTVSTEVFENNGILVTNVNYFTENIQKIAAPFRSSYW
ncbi:family with sequence similarity 208 member B [Cricetulus griseus]